MIQIRIVNSDGSNPIILEGTKTRTVYEEVNSSNEGVSFVVPKNAPKVDVLNPDTNLGYVRFWEAWDTEKNERLNYGPITTITEQETDWRVEGLGRSSLLNDFYKNKKTFYGKIDSIVDDLRFENVAIQPRTTTLVHDTQVTSGQTTIFSSITIDEKYHGLSQQTKDNVVDDNQGYIKAGEIEPYNSYYSTDSFWSGMSKNDTHVVDLGGIYDLSKITLVLPWWGGDQRLNNRTYDFRVSYANDTEAPVTTIQGRDFGPFHTIYDSGTNTRLIFEPGTFLTLWMGTTVSGIGFDVPVYYTLLSTTGPISARYIRTEINNVYAWYGSVFDSTSSQDNWSFQCDPNYSGGVMAGKTINERVLEPANDCYASVVELGAHKEIVARDTVKSLALQRIDNNNLQITYLHVPDPSETKTTSSGYRKFEPGGFFRNFKVNYSGAGSNYKTFYSTDCTNCYPDGFNFGVLDQGNTLVYSTTNSAGTGVAIKSGAYTSHVLMKGTSNATVVECDAWPAVIDPLSWGGSYSYTEQTNDYATIHFRGESFKWYATVPSGKTGATVKIEIRNKDVTGTWTSWSTLETGLVLPTDVSAELVYQISYESGALQPDTIYQIKITNLGGYCSIDSLEGYWSGSMTSYNEDSPRIKLYRPETINQIYDKRFSAGSMYKWNTSNFVSFWFEGDRVVVYSAKGRNHGQMKVLILKKTNGSIYDNYPNPDVVFIPGGDPISGALSINLDTGKRGEEITQFVLFDSSDYFTDGLPWDRYFVGIYMDQLESYSTVDTFESDNFVERCSDCVTPTGDSITQNKFVYFDGVAAHETVGVSVSFNNETHLDILKSLAEAVQVEWDVTEQGLKFEPRIGTDTDEVLREGQNTLVDWQVVNDVTKVASMLVSSGADIDGLPLFAVTENKKTRDEIGRTIMRQQDFRNIADYFQLIGLSRTELRKRRVPEKRITVSHIAKSLNLNKGDSFILYTRKAGPIRVRIMRKQRTESSSGTVFDLECVVWPQII